MNLVVQFEEQLYKDLHHFLLSMKEVDERLQDCPDVRVVGYARNGKQIK